MKKLLFVTTRLFWPIDSGRKVSLYYYCKGLHDVYGYEIYLYSFLESGQTVDLTAARPEFIREICLAKPISKGTKLTNVLFRSGFDGWPFQNFLYYSTENVRALREYAAAIGPDLVIVDMIRLAPYFNAIKALSCKKILDLDDLLSVRYFRQAQWKGTAGQIFGTYSSELSQREQKIAESGAIKRLILRSEGRRVRRAECKYGKRYDRVVFVSDKETAVFNRTVPGNKAVTVRLGVDYAFYASGLPVQKERGAIGFLGNFKVAANVDSLELIARKILPGLSFPYKLYVVGVVPEEIKSVYADDPGIVFCGHVEDPRVVLGKCELFLSPIAYGTGIKTKILEAMAMGLPVITNSVGAEGIDGVNGEHFVVEDDVTRMRTAVETLMADRCLAEKIARNAQRLIEERYSWDKIYRSFQQIF